MTVVEAIGELFAGPGARDYLGEPVTIGTHMLQAGALAEAAGAGAALVAAALLHDVGHLRQEPSRVGMPGGSGGVEPPRELAGSSPRASTDSRHGAAGAAWLGQWFGAAVTEPVRLHVAAKRYLCATEPGYFGLLSEESVRTLARQGGPMTPGRGRRVRGAAARAGRGGGAPLGRRGQGPGGHAAGLRALRAAARGADRVLSGRACGTAR